MTTPTEHQKILRARRESLGIFTIKDVAAFLGCSDTALHLHIKSGKIPAPRFRKGGKRLHYNAEDREAIRIFWFGLREMASA